MDPPCFDADPAQNIDADPDPDPGGWGRTQPKMCIPLGKILGTPLCQVIDDFITLYSLLVNNNIKNS